MVYLDTLSFVTLGLAAVLFQRRGELRLTAIIVLFLYLATALVVLKDTEDAAAPVYLLLGLVAANFLISALFKVFNSGFYKLIVPTVSILIWILLHWDQVIIYQGTSTGLVNKFFIAGAFFALFGREIVSLKANLMARIFGLADDGKSKQAMIGFIIAMILFLGMFASSGLGVLLLAGIYLMSSFYGENNSFSSALLPLGVALAVSMAGSVEIYLLTPDVLLGLLLAFFTYRMSAPLLSKQGTSVPSLGLVLILPAFFSVSLFIGGTVFELMGGIDAYAAFLIGLTLVALNDRSALLSVGLVSLTIGTGLFMRSLYPTEVNGFEESKQKAVQKELLVQYAPMNEVFGRSYSIIADSSFVAFELGKHKETKGRFKKVNGTIRLEENETDAQVMVRLDLGHFTTFNSFRDKELMGKAYFKKDQFPEMSYKADRISKMNETTYELSGEFSMLGVKRPLNVVLRRVVNSGNVRLEGTGELDRTKFGMSPSAAEGKVVHFSFAVLLEAKN